MKKKIFTKKRLIILSVILLALAGVLVIGNLIRSYQRRYQPLEVGGYASIVIGDHEYASSLETKNYEKALLSEKKKSVEFDGVLYEADYKITQKGYWYHNELDIYRRVADGNVVHFGVNTATGRIDLLTFSTKSYDKNKKALTREECFALAKDYLKEYVDVADYTLYAENYHEMETYTGTYEFQFMRMIGEMETCDTATIEITVYGDVRAHIFQCLGELKGAKAPSTEVMATVEKNITNKMAEIYGSLSDTYRYTYEVDKLMLVKMANGKLALEYEIDVVLEPVGQGDTKYDTTHFVVYIE